MVSVVACTYAIGSGKEGLLARFRASACLPYRLARAERIFTLLGVESRVLALIKARIYSVRQWGHGNLSSDSLALTG